jgi:hypothetical protein
VFYDRIRGDYYTFNCLQGIWQKTDKAGVGLYLGAQNLVDAYNRTNEIILKLITDGHFVLDVLGMVPIIGGLADIANGVWYFVEGNKLDATLSFVGAIPAIGELAVGAKLFLGAAAAGGATYLIVKNVPFKKWVKAIKTTLKGEKILDFVKFGEKLSGLGIPDDAIGKILKNLDESADADLVARLFDNPDGLGDVWKFLKDADDPIFINSGKLFDPETLDIVMRQYKNENFLKALGNNDIEAGKKIYAEIIQKYKGGCKTCGELPSDLAKVGFTSDMLKNLERWSDKLGNIEGFSEIIKGLHNKGLSTQNSVNFVMELAMREGRPITAFEFLHIPPREFRADFVVEIPNGRMLVEAKSWPPNYILQVASKGGLTDQLFHYFKNPPFEMWFDYRELESTYGFDEATQFLRGVYKDVIIKNADALMKDSRSKAYFVGLGFDSADALKSLKLTDEVLDFVKLRKF